MARDRPPCRTMCETGAWQCVGVCPHRFVLVVAACGSSSRRSASLGLLDLERASDSSSSRKRVRPRVRPLSHTLANPTFHTEKHHVQRSSRPGLTSSQVCMSAVIKVVGERVTILGSPLHESTCLQTHTDKHALHDLNATHSSETPSTMTMTMTLRKVQHLLMETWPYRRECRGHDP